MINFQSYNPTRIIFGKDVYKNVGEEIKKYGSRILMVYGGKSLKANGTYDEVKASLDRAGISVWELAGVQPNPRLALVYEGIQIVKENHIEMILAVGGGSVIDTAKAVAAGVYYDGDVWDLYSTEKQPEKVMDVGVILTIPAAGSESSDGSVITREKDLMKCSCCTDLFFPKFAMLDPQLCYTLPDYQVSAGGSDILAHIMERYFVPDDHHDFSDRMCEAAMISLIEALPKVLKNRQDYDAWAEVMWIGNIAHNGLLGRGKRDDWGSHNVEHQLSAHYDIAHGAGLLVHVPGNCGMILACLESGESAPAHRVNAFIPQEGVKTRIWIHCNTGYGNALYIRGNTKPLDWSFGQRCENMDADTWVFELERPVNGKITFKILMNDCVWEVGKDREVAVGESVEVWPVF